LNIGHVLKTKPLSELLLALVVARDVGEEESGLLCDLHRQSILVSKQAPLG